MTKGPTPATPAATMATNMRKMHSADVLGRVTCPQCRKAFQKRRTWQRFCSDACHDMHWGTSLSIPPRDLEAIFGDDACDRVQAYYLRGTKQRS